MASPTDSVQPKRQNIHYIVLAAAVIACLVPFSGKAFNVDDTLFIYVARQITQHPLDPYGFKVNWFLDAVPMAYETKNPPLAAYYIAAAASFCRMVGTGFASRLPPACADGSPGHISAGAAVYEFAAARGRGHVAHAGVSCLRQQRDVRHDDAGALAVGHHLLD